MKYLKKFNEFITEAKFKQGDMVMLKGDDPRDPLKFAVASSRKMFASDLMAYTVVDKEGNTIEYSEDQLELIKETQLNEFVGGALEKRNNVLYDKLVPGQGNSDFIEGEMLRAINRIIYRFYNDGDFFYKGYGAETAGPAHSFLINSREIPFEIQMTLQSIFNKIMKSSYPADGSEDQIYERGIKMALEQILDYIEGKAGNYTESNEDMFNYESEY